MLVQSFFHLDCRPVIPECGFQCDRCLAEINTVLTGMDGVSSVSKGKRGATDGIIVRYDLELIGKEDLLTAFRRLPSQFRGHFVPSLPEN